MSNDSSSYFRDLQNIATEQDRAKFAALVVEFGSTLQQLPKLRQEIDGFLTPNQSVDYAELVRSVRPKLEQAAAFLFEIDQLPAELRNAREVVELVKTSKASMILQTVTPLKSQLSSVCSTVQESEHRRAKMEKFSMIMGLICGAFVFAVLIIGYSAHFIAALMMGGMTGCLVFGSVAIAFELFTFSDYGQKRWIIGGMITGVGLVIAIILGDRHFTEGDFFWVWMGGIVGSGFARLFYEIR